jgi:D-alanine--poly(phosphoribitol) ligase subunit 2
MAFDKDTVQQAIRLKVIELANTMGEDASELTVDEIIPASGFIDSSALLDLIAWFEATYRIAIPATDLTIDNLGSAALMADYLMRRTQGN